MRDKNAAAIENIASLYTQKRFDEAEQLCRKVLLEFPENVDVLKFLGVILWKKGKAERALSFLQKAIALKPDAPDIMNLTAIVCGELGNYETAEELYKKALALKPENPEILYNYANLKTAMNCQDEAAALYAKAISLKPDYFSAFINLGNTYKKLNKFALAIEAYEKALALRPDSYEAYLNKGNALQGLFLFEDSIEAYEKAHELNPASPDPFKNMGDAYKNLLRPDEALGHYAKALKLKPEDADAHMFSGMALLLQGDFSEGWKEYEWRLRRPEFSRLASDLPGWKGEVVPEKTILVSAEQGFGDTVQFCRYLPLVKERCGRLVFLCQAPLIPLLEKQNLADEILPLDTRHSAVDSDYHIPLLSLPSALKQDSFFAGVPYIKAEAAKISNWREKLKNTKGRKLGVCWSGSPTNTNDFNRSMPFPAMEKLFDLPDTEFFCLQKTIQPSAGKFHNFSEELKDFSETAALVENMDLVISVDTVIAHLAGAMGKKTALLLPFVPEWRWLLNRSDSPWYSGAFKIYRQPGYGNWAALIEKLKAELR